jgi:hypothetical protein
LKKAREIDENTFPHFDFVYYGSARPDGRGRKVEKKQKYFYLLGDLKVPKGKEIRDGNAVGISQVEMESGLTGGEQEKASGVGDNRKRLGRNDKSI